MKLRWFNRFVLLLLFVAAGWGIHHALTKGALEDSDENPESTQQSSIEEEEDVDTTEAIPDTESDSLPELSSSTLNLALQKDSLLGARMDQLLRQQRPGAAVYVTVDMATNEILAWGARSDSLNHATPHWLGKSTFPAASLIKIVTSAAAIESNRYDPLTEIPMIGRSTTLYYRQLKVPKNYKGPHVTLQDAFAKSINPAMGLIGKELGGKRMKSTAFRFGFNRPFPGNFPQISRFMPPDTGFALAEATSGFTSKNTISVLHAAAMVRSMLTRKDLEIPWSPLLGKYGVPTQGVSLQKSDFRAETYGALRQLFLRTVSHGTARKHLLRQVPAKFREKLLIGGKTGSLDGKDPTGRYDWFAGYAQFKDKPGQGIIVVVMQVHQKYRTLPSPGIAGSLITTWARNAQ